MKPTTSPPAQLGGVFLILALTFAAYFPALSGTFIWQDYQLFVGNPLLKTTDGLYQIWFTRSAAEYLPVSYTLCWLEEHLFHQATFGYHVVNIFLHSTAAVLLWRLLRQLKVPAAWLIGAAFALHPVTAQTVASISGVKTILGLLFSLLTLLSYVRFQKEGSWKFYVLALLSFVLAGLSSNTVLLLPLLLLVLSRWSLEQVPVKATVSRVIPFLAGAVAFIALSFWFSLRRGTGTAAVYAWPERLVLAGDAFWLNLKEAFFPANIIFAFPVWSIDPHGVKGFLPLILLCVLFLGLLFFSRTRKKAVLLPFLAVLFLLPAVFGLLDIRSGYFLVANNGNYFGLAIILSSMLGGIAWLLSRRGIGKQASRIMAGVLLVGLGTLMWNEARAYRSHEHLWDATIQRQPRSEPVLVGLTRQLMAHGVTTEAIHLLEKAPRNAEAQAGLGTALFISGKTEEAMTHYQRAIALDPNYGPAHTELALSLEKQGHPDLALPEYLTAIRLQPADALAQNNASSLLLQNGKIDQALEHAMSAVRLSPDSAQPYYNVGSVLALQGKNKEAAEAFLKAVQLQSRYPEAYFNLGIVLARLGKTGPARESYSMALVFQPNNVEAHYNLGDLLLKEKNLAEAKKHFLQIIVDLDASHPGAHLKLGVIAAEQKHYAEAVSYFREAIQLKPSWAEPLNRLTWLLATCPDDAIRNGAEAMRLGKRLEAFGGSDSEVFDTLAAAAAETGDFDEAVAYEQRAIELAGKAKANAAAMNHFEASLKQFQSHQPYREP